MSTRQAFLLIGEAAVAETRAARLDLHARTKFTKEGREITESRAVIEQLLDDPAHVAARDTARSLAGAAGLGLVEMG